jgi:putative hydrolase of the HAD superfamily
MNAPPQRLPATDPSFSRKAFLSARSWVFDLDNTLYPRHANLYEQVDRRIRDYVQRLLKLPSDEAQRLQKDYYRRYGTTLRGLIVEHGISPDDFLEYVHDIDHSAIQPDPRLAAAIERLPGPKFILTNGSRAHAEKVAARLGVTHHFEDIFDIVRAELLPKPNRETYDRFVSTSGIDPKATVIFEDLARNLAVPHDLGMTTVLVVPGRTQGLILEDWELEGQDAAHVDFLTENLTTFLERVIAIIGR